MFLQMKFVIYVSQGKNSTFLILSDYLFLTSLINVAEANLDYQQQRLITWPVLKDERS